MSVITVRPRNGDVCNPSERPATFRSSNDTDNATKHLETVVMVMDNVQYYVDIMLGPITVQNEVYGVKNEKMVEKEEKQM